MKKMIVVLLALSTMVQANTLPDLKFNLVDLASENPSGLTHALFFPEYFAAHSIHATSGNGRGREDFVVTTYAVGSLAAVAAVSPEGAALSFVSGLTEGAGEAFNKEQQNVAVAVLADIQDYYVTKQVSVQLESVISLMDKFASQKFETEDAIERLSLVANRITNNRDNN